MKVKVNQLKENENNPRVIRDEQFKKLVKSIKDFPEMLHVRKLVCTPDLVVLGGNMRLKALKEAGVKDVEIEIVDWSKEKQNEFIIKDNIGYGSWDYEILANEWEVESLDEWGLEIPGYSVPEIDLDKFFEDKPETESDGKEKIVLEYTAEEHQQVLDAFKKHEGSREAIVARLLGVEFTK